MPEKEKDMPKKLLRYAALLMAAVFMLSAFAACAVLPEDEKTDLPLYTSDPMAMNTKPATEAAPTEAQAQPTAAPAETSSAAARTVAPQTDAPQTFTPTATPTAAPTAAPTATPCPVTEDGKYNTKDEVALYILLFGHLPDNYITKQEANRLGWTGGSLEPYAPGCSIGGDRFGNYEGLLPRASGRTYYECDIGTKGKSTRGSKRIVYSNDGLIYYTNDHYESFTLLYGGD